MHFTRFALICAFGVSVPIFVHAQQSPPPAPRDAQAVLVLQRSLAALTGTATVNDVTLTGTATRIAGSDNESGTVTLKATAIGQGRIDLSLSSGPRSEVIDISQASPVGNWSGPDGTWHPIASHNLWTDPTWFFPEFLIGRVLSNPSYAVSSVDSETLEGVAVQHLAIWLQISADAQTTKLIQGLSRMDIYLSSSTLVPVAVSFNSHPDGDESIDIPMEVKFSDYQTAQGALVPYQVQQYIQNGLHLDLKLQTVQMNLGLSTTDFQAQ
jgi:hypothetical protein